MVNKRKGIEMYKTNKKTDVTPKNLLSPPASQTESSVALIWEKPKLFSKVAIYHIYMDNNLVGTSRNTDFTINNIPCSQESEVYIKAILKNGEISLKSNTIKIKTKNKSKSYDITSFGAIGDGKTLCTRAIQNAINTCEKGGTVYIPKGTFVTGAIFLKSNMTLYIEDGGLLLGSFDTADYPLFKYRWEGLETTCYASLINTKISNNTRLENITIEGLGKIDANGSKLREKEITEQNGKPGRAICIRNVDNLYLKDITIKQSPAWCVHLIYCNRVSVNNIKIYTKRDEQGKKYEGIANGDGLNPDSSRDVYIFNSMISSQDDCIAIKSGRGAEGRMIDIPSENIRITNCTFKSGFGVAVGSEMSGNVRNVVVQDCDFKDVYSIGSIKAPRGRGGIVENINYKDCTLANYDLSLQDCKWFRGAIYIDQFYSHDTFDPNKIEELNEGTSIIKDINFENIELNTLTGNAVFLSGLPESPLQNIQLINVNAIGKYGCKTNNIKGFSLRNVTIKATYGENITFNNVDML
ncbi:glycoside hydrolase family 28 protein [Gracilibacillus massiliensis]|uniref:glycoside hydrolase family 28 protein n=1 Tax=Gracilibacillus massiliensis TaxID=1564956 RepID=UPI000AC6109D|nr:glycoside hydrolase family 28 protein [Gracilibacillus massiliensis]